MTHSRKIDQKKGRKSLASFEWLTFQSKAPPPPQIPSGPPCCLWTSARRLWIVVRLLSSCHSTGAHRDLFRRWIYDAERSSEEGAEREKKITQSGEAILQLIMNVAPSVSVDLRHLGMRASLCVCVCVCCSALLLSWRLQAVLRLPGCQWFVSPHHLDLKRRDTLRKSEGETTSNIWQRESLKLCKEGGRRVYRVASGSISQLLERSHVDVCVKKKKSMHNSKEWGAKLFGNDGKRGLLTHTHHEAWITKQTQKQKRTQKKKKFLATFAWKTTFYDGDVLFFFFKKTNEGVTNQCKKCFGDNFAVIVWQSFWEEVLLESVWRLSVGTFISLSRRTFVVSKVTAVEFWARPRGLPASLAISNGIWWKRKKVINRRLEGTKVSINIWIFTNCGQADHLFLPFLTQPKKSVYTRR